MQVKKPIALYLPGDFVLKLETVLKANPPDWNYRTEYFHYIAHVLIVKQNQQKKKEFYALNIKILKASTIWNIDKYITYLINGELLKRDSYKNGVKAFFYQIIPDLLNGHHAVSITPDMPLFDKIIQNHRNKQKHYNDPKRVPEFLRLMWLKFKSILMDYSAARDWINNKAMDSKKHIYLNALALFEDERFRYFKRNSTNKRLDTNLTNLKSELKLFFKGDYVQIDLANSQPFILSQFLTKFIFYLLNYTSTNNTTEQTIPLCFSYLEIDIIKHFGLKQVKDILKIPLNDTFLKNGELLSLAKSCEKGEFYEDMQLKLKEGKLKRKEVKQIMFAVIFSRNIDYENFRPFTPYKKEKECFAEIFPVLYRIIENLKQKDHAQLAILLQRIESTVFIDIICPRLVDLGIVPLTIHDSIIIEGKDAQTALNVCKSVFQSTFGSIPTFHVKKLAKQ